MARFRILPATHDREAAWGAPAHSALASLLTVALVAARAVNILS